MANVAIPAATAYLGGLTAATGILTAFSGNCTSISSGSSFTFAPVQVVNGVLTPVVLWVIVGAAGAGNFVFSATQPGGSNLTIAVANSASYILGPFDPSVYGEPASGTYPGQVLCTPSVFTGNSVGAFLLATPFLGAMSSVGVVTAAERALHNPFEATAGSPDF